jgi:hypothetical protein
LTYLKGKVAKNVRGGAESIDCVQRGNRVSVPHNPSCVCHLSDAGLPSRTPRSRTRGQRTSRMPCSSFCDLVPPGHLMPHCNRFFSTFPSHHDCVTGPQMLSTAGTSLRCPQYAWWMHASGHEFGGSKCTQVELGGTSVAGPISAKRNIAARCATSELQPWRHPRLRAWCSTHANGFDFKFTGHNRPVADPEPCFTYVIFTLVAWRGPTLVIFS